MNKSPVPSPDGVPACFGVQFDDRDLGCRRCEVAKLCAPQATAWGERRSLSEAVAALEAELSAPPSETIEQTYDRLHREIFGTLSTRKTSPANHLLFSRVSTMCEKEGFDVATYIAGNMWAMKPWVEANRRVGFQPSHLSGDKAVRRYYAYFGRQSRRFRQQRHTGQTGGTLVADIRQRLQFGFYEVALEYVRAFIAHGEADWSEAVKEAEPNEDWLALDIESTGKRGHELRNIFGRLRLRQERQLAELRAACAIAELYEHDLQHLIGIGPVFNWRSFAELLARLFPLPVDNLSTSVSEVSGVAWHGRD